MGLLHKLSAEPIVSKSANLRHSTSEFETSSGTSGTANSIPRRIRDPNFLMRYFVGRGIDIGATVSNTLGNYCEFFPLCKSIKSWDIDDGDAQYMEGVPDKRYDFVHSSHCLEHIIDPYKALEHWWRILRPGGHLIVIVPDEDLYEQGVWPSQFNGDHIWSFTTYKDKSWCPTSINVFTLLTWLANVNPDVDIIKVERLIATHRFHAATHDQSATHLGEPAIEFVVRKTHVRQGQ
jgi:SAM-dependent methyltransferase